MCTQPEIVQIWRSVQNKGNISTEVDRITSSGARKNKCLQLDPVESKGKSVASAIVAPMPVSIDAKKTPTKKNLVWAQKKTIATSEITVDFTSLPDAGSNNHPRAATVATALPISSPPVMLMV
ncbi:uncharacterized protein LOC121049343 [Rosa chinensis]|uniref:uncharacterized protein LOC121049343 n=1 Tax=Rosa chinensis TaxID=74649 RepID=UPI001AD8F65C|nr:uncharacterized protein LOC121049343 [Rosa chinensis]